jgi:acetyl/propionyl-CoA carboxylase alpha subunit
MPILSSHRRETIHAILSTFGHVYNISLFCFACIDIQVEHPITEWIAGINLPAAQVAVGMGIPLWQIPGTA